MTIDEFKLKLMKFGNNMINSYFPGNSMTDKTANSMIKYILKNKINDMDAILSMFTTSNGEIDIEDFTEFMKENMIGQGLRINFHDYIPENSILKTIVPNRTMMITKDDLNCFIK
jgi:uncharacterized radical SAM superfamily protein